MINIAGQTKVFNCVSYNQMKYFEQKRLKIIQIHERFANQKKPVIFTLRFLESNFFY